MFEHMSMYLGVGMQSKLSVVFAYPRYTRPGVTRIPGCAAFGYNRAQGGNIVYTNKGWEAVHRAVKLVCQSVLGVHDLQPMLPFQAFARSNS